MQNMNETDPLTTSAIRGSDAPLSVCWDIANLCNDKCAFCYRELDMPSLSVEQHQKILDKIIDANVQKISFIGGEPLTVSHLPILLERAHRANIQTSIVTNGILLREKWNNIVDYVNWITLPIDGSNEEIQRKMTRKEGHLQSVLSLREFIKDSAVNVKINTIIGRHNLSDLPNIAQLIKRLDVQRWKIFQFMAIRGYAMQNARQFEIDDQKFSESVKNMLKNVTESLKYRVTIADREYMQRNYFSILQDGNVRVTVDGEDKIVGSLLSQSVMEIWQSPFFDHRKHVESRRWLKSSK